MSRPGKAPLPDIADLEMTTEGDADLAVKLLRASQFVAVSSEPSPPLLGIGA